MHWTPITSFCTPCQLKFDVIMRFETLEEDQRYLINKVGLGSVIKPEHMNTGKGNTNQHLMNQYAELTKSQVRGLYEFFKYDFELFDYTADEFISAALDADTNS